VDGRSPKSDRSTTATLPRETGKQWIKEEESNPFLRYLGVRFR